MKVEKYDNNFRDTWNNFINESKNGHFMFHRDYMEYHSDRFEDHSLLVLNQKGNVILVLPASINNNEIISHQGLSFGGYVYNDKLKTSELLNAHEAVINYLKEKGIKKFIYKVVPQIYSLNPSEEDLYLLFKEDFKLYRRDISSTINLNREIAYSSRKKRSIKKSKKSGIKYRENKDFSEYWKILTSVLEKSHNTSPVHNIDEIQFLKNKFPENIKLYEALINEEVVAGTVLFVNNNVTHTQYLAVNDLGRQNGALDGLIDHLLENNYYNSQYFDFGISTEEGGKKLNEGLITHKEEYGAHGIVHDFYELIISP